MYVYIYIHIHIYIFPFPPLQILICALHTGTTYPCCHPCADCASPYCVSPVYVHIFLILK